MPTLNGYTYKDEWEQLGKAACSWRQLMGLVASFSTYGEVSFLTCRNVLREWVHLKSSLVENKKVFCFLSGCT